METPQTDASGARRRAQRVALVVLASVLVFFSLVAGAVLFGGAIAVARLTPDGGLTAVVREMKKDTARYEPGFRALHLLGCAQMAARSGSVECGTGPAPGYPQVTCEQVAEAWVQSMHPKEAFKASVRGLTTEVRTNVGFVRGKVVTGGEVKCQAWFSAEGKAVAEPDGG